MIIDIENRYSEPIPEEYEGMLSDIAKEALAMEDIQPEGAVISLVLTDDEDIRQMNEQYRGIDSSTDVLSFPMFEGETIVSAPDMEYILGDIVISIPVMKRQAREYGHSEKREFAFLFTHGMLHLLGYDHIQEDERMQMESIQTSILDKLGIKR